MADRTDATATPPIELAPEPPPRGPWVWARQNLFSTPFNTTLTLVASSIVVLFLRGMLGFIINPGRRWDAITTNMRLLFVQAYPNSDFLRIWLSIGVLVALAMLSLAFWRVGGKTTMAKITKGVMGTGVFVAFVALLSYTIVGVEETLTIGPLTLEITPTKTGFLIAGLLIFAVGFIGRQLAGDRLKEPLVPTLGVVALVALLVVGLLWVIRVPVPIVGGGQELRGLAGTTKTPLTVLFFVAAAVYWIGVGLRNVIPEQLGRRILVGAWIASFPLLTLVLLRSPSLDIDAFLAKAGTMFGDSAATGVIALVLATAVGGILIYIASLPRFNDLGRVLTGVVVFGAILSWVFPALMLYRLGLLLLVVFMAGAPTFAGNSTARRNYLIGWVISAGLLVFLLALGEAASSIDTPGRSFMGGLMLTWVLAIAGIALSFPLGVLLALGRTSTMPIFRMMSVVYIEVVRGVPLITWLIVGSVIFPLFLPEGLDVDSIVRAIIAIALFSAAYLAENVRGGLQSIPKGQYEAARALGMTTAQMTIFIVLPQALRAVIPALVGQVIAIFKDTSLVTIIGLFDFLHIARSVIPSQTQPFNFLGTLRETLVFAAIVYWIVTFSISRASLRLEKKLGVGER